MRRTAKTDGLHLPRGTVTFLFTDIEGSTALWEQDATAMRAAVERHLALLGGDPEAAKNLLAEASPLRRAIGHT